jgi:class 3 adenylate cyclase
MIFDEPVRGRVPPPWFWALSGMERLRSVQQGLLPLPPTGHLLGVRAAHIGPGSGTWTMPASMAFETEAGTLDTAPLQETALTEVAMTTLPPEMDANPITITVNYFRPTRPQAGNLLARARVVNASRFFIFAEVEIEDPLGRRIAHASSHLRIRRVEPGPPAAPARLQPAIEPNYGTPDPYLRQQTVRMPALSIWQEKDGDQALRMFADRTYMAPYQMLMPVEYVLVEQGRVAITLDCSEWLCRYSPEVTQACLASFANRAGWYASLTIPRGGQSLAALEQTTRFTRPVRADGRVLRAEATARLEEDTFIVAEAIVVDADGRQVSSAHSYGVVVENVERQRRPARQTKRILTTLLFTDVVGSTEHAKQLGDARWQALLEKHRAIIRKEISHFDGIEVQTTGDGFLIRFEAPVHALECARAIRLALQRIDIGIRVGLHTGECELADGNVSGMAVHIAARVQAIAPPGEIFVSGTLKDLALGSDISFEDRGVHALKGVPGEWHLFALAV